MFKKILLIVVTSLFIFAVNTLSFAMMCGTMGGHKQTSQAESTEHKHSETEVTAVTTTQEAIDVGNKICPVSGENIDEKTKVTYEYEGKIYNFCCEMCIDEFKKDPDKYIKKVEEELKTQAKEGNEITPAMHEGRQH